MIPPNDGIYIEREVNIQIPLDVKPDFPRPPLSLTDDVCPGLTRGAFIMIRHSYILTIGIWGGNDLKLEAICYISPTTKKECIELLEQQPDIMPNLDYDRNIGLENWVPDYLMDYSKQLLPDFVNNPRYRTPMKPMNIEIDEIKPPLYEQALVGRSTDAYHLVFPTIDTLDLTGKRDPVLLRDSKLVEYLMNEAMSDNIYL